MRAVELSQLKIHGNCKYNWCGRLSLDQKLYIISCIDLEYKAVFEAKGERKKYGTILRLQLRLLIKSRQISFFTIYSFHKVALGNACHSPVIYLFRNLTQMINTHFVLMIFELRHHYKSLKQAVEESVKCPAIHHSNIKPKRSDIRRKPLNIYNVRLHVLRQYSLDCTKSVFQPRAICSSLYAYTSPNQRQRPIITLPVGL